MKQEKIWDEIADQWNDFRQQKFKPTYDFLERFVKNKGKILEIGCGNCRNLIPFAKLGLECYGVDFSENMLLNANKLMRKNHVKINLKKADMKKLPYKDDYFDYVLHIASLHHLSNEENILRALNETYRVLKKEGLTLLTVWNKLQLKFLLKPRELYIPWKKKGKKYQRFFHLFDYFEVKNLLKKTRFKVVESNIFGKNLVFVLKK